MKPSHLREMYYKKECKRTFSKFALFLYSLFPEQLSDIEGDPMINMYGFYISKIWHENINYFDVDVLIGKYCDVEEMCQYTERIRLYKLKKRYSPSQD